MPGSTIFIFPNGPIPYHWNHEFLRLIAAHWQEARQLLYNGSFADSLKNGRREDWEKLARTIPAAQPDQDVGLGCFAMAVSLASDKWVSPGGMLAVAKMAAQSMSPASANEARIRQLLEAMPRIVRIYHEDDSSPGFFYEEVNEAYRFLAGLINIDMFPAVQPAPPKKVSFKSVGDPTQDADQLLALDPGKALDGLRWKSDLNLQYALEIVRALSAIKNAASRQLLEMMEKSNRLPKGIRRQARKFLVEKPE